MISDDEIKECVWRHIHFLELKLKHPKVEHRKGCTRGKRQWYFTWKWPFVRTWISQAICMCEIIAMEEMVTTFDAVIPILRDAGYDYTPMVLQDMREATVTNLRQMPVDRRAHFINLLSTVYQSIAQRPAPGRPRAYWRRRPSREQ